VSTILALALTHHSPYLVVTTAVQSCKREREDAPIGNAYTLGQLHKRFAMGPRQWKTQ
jgi:hypothetical protein